MRSLKRLRLNINLFNVMVMLLVRMGSINVAIGNNTYRVAYIRAVRAGSNYFVFYQDYTEPNWLMAVQGNASRSKRMLGKKTGWRGERFT